jgi:hypothetical protein
VQIREPEKASQHHYSSERMNAPGAVMPTRLRRLAVTLAYLVGVAVAFSVLLVGLEAAGMLSRRCVSVGNCTRNEKLLLELLFWAWIVASALCAGLGWWGRLLGARVRPGQS